jgi:GNAT superfamily N-acetyltransferase
MMTAHPDTPGEWFQFAVALRATGQLIGDCAAMPRADDPGQCEIGFTIAPRYQGRGYATEAVRLLVGYLFARVWLELTDDPASVLVIRPAEFDRKAETRIPLPRCQQIVVDSEALYTAVSTPGRRRGMRPSSASKAAPPWSAGSATSSRNRPSRPVRDHQAGG